MNYRGSGGYGQDFSKLLEHQIGRSVQDDIEDGTRWAITHKIADPDRVAILGADYGGYSALFALGKNPGLYRCGISIDGITDWVRLIKGMSGEEKQFERQHWVEQLGDPKTDTAYLENVSPVDFADKITAPVLIIHGKEDRVVPPKQSHVMISALEKAGHEPESLFLSNQGHMPFYEKARTEAFKRIEAFLAKNLTPEKS